MSVISDTTIYSGRPENSRGRLANELAVYDFLDGLGIAYQRVDHGPAMTIEDCADIDRLLGTQMCKNLFLCNSQKTRFYLVLLPGEKHFQTKLLSAQLGCARLSFAPGELMEGKIGCLPGSASVLGMLFDPDRQVTLCVDDELLAGEYIGCHPCANTSSLRLKMADLLEKILPALGREPVMVKL